MSAAGCHCFDLPGLFIDLFEHVKQFVNLKFTVRESKIIHHNPLSSSEDSAEDRIATKLAFKKALSCSQAVYLH